MAQSIARSGEKSKTAKTVLNLETGIYYGTIKEAAFAHGLSRTVLSDRLNGKKRNTTSIIFAESKNDGIYPIIPELKEVYIPKPHSVESRKQQVKTMIERGHYNGILILDTSTGIFYNNIREAAEALCINFSTLTQRLNGGLKNNTSLIRV